MIKLEFHGAARTVTGSAHIVRVNGKTILLECGLFQGKREEVHDIATMPHPFEYKKYFHR